MKFLCICSTSDVVDTAANTSSHNGNSQQFFCISTFISCTVLVKLLVLKVKDFYVLIKFKISGDQEFRLFSYNELKAATASFKSSNKIGQGGFGSVYKVIIFGFVPHGLLSSKLSCLFSLADLGKDTGHVFVFL